jgi:FeS assembly protein IscX
MHCLIREKRLVRLDWEATEAIAAALMVERPGDDLSRLSDSEIRRRVIRLTGFDDDPAAADGATLEAIRDAWRRASR